MFLVVMIVVAMPKSETIENVQLPDDVRVMVESVYMAENPEIDMCTLKSIECGEYDEMYSFVEVEAIVYAYNSLPNQTDDDPFITASGMHVIEGIVANNCLAFGTMVEIDGFVCEVQDRMNSRYGCEVFDIWMRNYDDAKNWGKKNIIVKIYE